MARCFSSRAPVAVLLLLLPGLARAQEIKLLPSDGASSDVFGQSASLSGDGQYALAGAWQHDHPSFLSGSAYVFVRSGSAWSEQAELTASDAATGDEFGNSVSISGDGRYALVGAPGDDDTFFLTGSAYVFVRVGDTWTQQAKLHASDAGETDRFGLGTALSADGSLALVGARLDEDNGSDSGSAYVFRREGDTWVEEAKLLPDDGAALDNFGLAAALSADGEYALVGAWKDDDAGAESGSAYVFARDGGTWTQQAKLTAADGTMNDLFGHAVGLSEDGTYAVVGASSEDGADGGSAYVFVRTGATWAQQAKLTASDGAAGDQLGYSVAINGAGTVVLAGANAEDDGGSDAGSAYVFVRTGSAWAEAGTLMASDAESRDFFGRSVSLSADARYALVGADGNDDNGGDSGSAYVFEDFVAVAAEAPAPSEALRLSAAAPNPFRSEARLTLTLAEAQAVTVAVYDLLGRRVAVLHEGPVPAATPLTLVWEAGAAAPGLYVVRAEGETFRAARRLVRLR